MPDYHKHGRSQVVGCNRASAWPHKPAMQALPPGKPRTPRLGFLLPRRALATITPAPMTQAPSTMNEEPSTLDLGAGGLMDQDDTTGTRHPFSAGRTAAASCATVMREAP
jgi:hypothetical protein